MDSIGRVTGLVVRLVRFFSWDLWVLDPGRLPRHLRWLVRLVQVAYLSAKGFRDDHCTMRAAALTYTTLLSLVPVAAVALVAAKGFGAWEHLRAEVIEPSIDRFGQMGELIRRVIEMVETTNFASLGIFGVLLLFVTVISVMGNVERSFNHIWGVRRQRGWFRRFTDYTSVLVLAPLLLMAAGAIEAMSGRLSGLLGEGSQLQRLFSAIQPVGMILIWTVFTFVYRFIPNTRVPFWSAAVAGVVAGTLYKLMAAVFFGISFFIYGYNKIYAGLAALPVTFVWINASWVVTLFGAELAYALPNVRFHFGDEQLHGLSIEARERLSVRIFLLVSGLFIRGEPADDAVGVAGRLGLPYRVAHYLLGRLAEAGLLTEIPGEERVRYQPAIDVGGLTLGRAVELIRRAGNGLEAPAGDRDGRLEQAFCAGYAGFLRSGPASENLARVLGRVGAGECDGDYSPGDGGRLE